ncbi:DUF4405 domain-containing protein [bacterium]|nr:DUF4405 domain-containing protein [bacterium]
MKTAINILMTLLLMAAMAYHYTGQMWHEITGTAMFVLFVVHNALNYRWYRSLLKGKYNAARILMTVTNALLVIDILLLMLSGMSISFYVFKFLPDSVSLPSARSIHLIASYAGFLLISFHIGLHMRGVFGKIWNKIRLFSEKQKGLGFIRGLFVLLVAAACFYGIYAFKERNFWGYISGSTMFAFFDYSESPVWFFLDYAAIMLFMAVSAFLLQKLSAAGGRAVIIGIKRHVSAHKVRCSVIAGAVVLAVLFFFLFGASYVRRHFQTVNIDRAQAVSTERIDMKGKKGIIVYFTRVGNTAFAEGVDAVSSASLMTDGANLIGNSELLSEMIANATVFPVYAIKTKNKYSSSYTATVIEAGKDLRGERPVELEDDVPELSEYDTVILVYPLWWGTLPVAVQKFLTESRLEGKTLYSLVTHGGGGFGSALQDTPKWTAARVSNAALSVYDDEVTAALPKIVSWLEKIADN